MNSMGIYQTSRDYVLLKELLDAGNILFGFLNSEFEITNENKDYIWRVPVGIMVLAEDVGNFGRYYSAAGATGYACSGMEKHWGNENRYLDFLDQITRCDLEFVLPTEV